MPTAQSANTITIASRINTVIIKALLVHAILASGVMIGLRSEEHTSEFQSLISNSYAFFCLRNKKTCIKFGSRLVTTGRVTARKSGAGSRGGPNSKEKTEC